MERHYLTTAIPYVTGIIALVVIADFFLPLSTAALGGTAFLTIIVGFAAQRFLMDIVAGTLIVFERWYARVHGYASVVLNG